MIGISITTVLDGIYAGCALRRAKGGDVPELLTRRHDAMLRRTARDVMARIFISLVPYVTNSNVADLSGDDDIITIEFDPEPACEGVLKVELESLLTAGILAAAGVGDAGFYTALSALRDSLAPAAGTGRIRRA